MGRSDQKDHTEGREGGKSKYSKTGSRYLAKKNKPSPQKEFSKKNKPRKSDALPKFDDKIRLNKYIANAGICSRREADTLISTGVVTVNDEVVTEMGYKVSPNDVVKFDGETIRKDVKRYVLLNKPVDFSIRPDKIGEKKSVFQLIKNACKEEVYPIGKMDKNACGLLLFTNDGDVNIKLTHPNNKTSQLFHVVLNREMTEEDLAKLTSGLYVDDMMFSAKEANFVKGKPRNEIGVKILSSKSNLVKLMIGKLDYKIVKLDRVEFSGLTKKDLPRGHYRHLTEKEVIFLIRN